MFKTRLNTQGVQKFSSRIFDFTKKKYIFFSYNFLAMYDIFQLEIKEGRFELILLLNTQLKSQGVHKFLHGNLNLQRKYSFPYNSLAIYDIFHLEIKEGRFELILLIQNTVKYTGCSKIP